MQQATLQALQRYAKHAKREQYKRWIEEGCWHVGGKHKAILEFLRAHPNATRQQIEDYLVHNDYADFQFTSEPLQRLLVFGAIERNTDKRPHTYKLTEYGARLVKELEKMELRNLSTVVPIEATSEPQLLKKVW